MSTTEEPTGRSRRARWEVSLAGLAVIAAAAIGLMKARSIPRHPSPSDPGPRIVLASHATVSKATVSWRIVHEGIEVEMTIDPLRDGSADDVPIHEGDDVRIRFKVADTTSGAPLKNVYPAAWMTARGATETGQKGCVEKVQTLIGGSLLAPPELDLNVYHILTLNDDATVTVLDPRFGFGGTKFLALVSLAGIGQDWALSRDESRLFVAMPEVGKVAVVDTSTWTVLENLEVGPLPTRVELQPDGHYLWVAHDPAGKSGSSLTAIDVEGRKVAGTVRVGQGPHELAFGADSHHAFVTNAQSGTLSIVDTRLLKTIAEITVGPRSTSIAYSALADAIYLTDAVQGSIIAIDARSRRVVSKVQAEPGLGQIAFAPGGRLGFIVNPRHNRLSILDASSNRLIQSATLREGPDQIAFSDGFAYIRHRGTENVLMVPLAQVGVEGRPIPTIDFPAGQNPLGRTSRASPAAAIVQAPGENAVLIANPSDMSIYYYKEGMAAPMGHFGNDKREPRAVLVVDRSLRDRGAPGVYETTARLRRPGSFDVVFFLATPRIVNCFPIVVAPDPALAKERDRLLTDVEPRISDPIVPAGEPSTLSFRLTDRARNSARTGLRDVLILAFAPGGWQARVVGREEPDGVYSAEVTPPQPGVYSISIGCESIGLALNRMRPVILEAVAPDPPVDESPDLPNANENTQRDLAHDQPQDH